MKNRIKDAAINAASMVLEGMALTFPLWVLAAVGSAVLGIMYLMG